ncbi:NgoMIV family type II restriction endonuclease [Marinobacter nauticus]|uniref:NgoMIV family type II restriction endonuclease n=1 Tax=Marinobacter nauticus TaxID=2743 RepID=UPI001C99C37C|nr:NgoMIV family type II restriction endonuclease [Marinobacter nauticus]MBY5960676.1 NgoMIV family type II restriction endonuclease [Marinobacter nauticus]
MSPAPAAAVAHIAEQRANFHRELFRRNILTSSTCAKSETGYIASNGDSGQKFSSTLSHKLAERLASDVGQSLPILPKKRDGQSLGNDFEALCQEFIRSCFLKMDHLRPGEWVIEQVGGRSEDKVSKYAQYSHLADLKRLAEQNTGLASFLGNGYTVAPDVIIARRPEPDSTINGGQTVLVDDTVATMATLRERNYSSGSAEEILHASVSCKFTMRSDRAQNTRTEALNLLRNRKGRSPHIVSVTAEPTPSRIASLALGTGDVDCVYHFALFELKELLEASDKWEDALDQLNVMIEGKRLRDISDLPLDLAV